MLSPPFTNDGPRYVDEKLVKTSNLATMNIFFHNKPQPFLFSVFFLGNTEFLFKLGVN